MAPYISKVEAHFEHPRAGLLGHLSYHHAAGNDTHAITEFRIARNLIRNAVEAERNGYAAMAITHFQDAGSWR